MNQNILKIRNSNKYININSYNTRIRKLLDIFDNDGVSSFEIKHLRIAGAENGQYICVYSITITVII